MINTRLYIHFKNDSVPYLLINKKVIVEILG